MSEEQWIRLILLLILLVFSAFFSGSETALMAIDRLRIKYLVQKKRKGAVLLEDTLSRPDRLLGAILVGNNLVNIAASVIATGLLISLFGDDGEWLTIVILTPVLLVFAEVVPKTYSAQQAEKVSFLVLRPIRWVMLLLTPVITVLSWATYLLTLWAGKKGEPAPIITEDEIHSLITVGEQSGVMDQEKREMLHGVLGLSETRVRDLMVPRPEMVAIDVKCSFREVLKLVNEASHSRFPVYEESLDNIVGVIHSKEILNYVDVVDFDLRTACRRPFFVPEAQFVETLLQAFRTNRLHMAIVVDEYGGVEGLVTLEDVVEEIVGEIHDEFDTEEADIREVGPQKYLVDASLALRELNRRLHLQLDEEHANTLAGYVLRLLGAMPKVGATCSEGGITYTVRTIDGHRIDLVEMQMPELPEEDRED